MKNIDIVSSQRAVDSWNEGTSSGDSVKLTYGTMGRQSGQAYLNADGDPVVVVTTDTGCGPFDLNDLTKVDEE